MTEASAAPHGTSTRAPRPGRPRMPLRGYAARAWIGIALGCVGFLAFSVWVSLQARERAIEAATSSAQNLALVLEKHAERTLGGTDMLLRAVLYRGTERLAGRSRHGRLLAFVEATTKDLTHVRAVKLMQADTGHQILFAGYGSAATPHIDAEVRERTAGDDGVHLTKPFYDADARIWLMGVSRRGAPGTDAQGFLAIAYVDLGPLQAFYDNINVGRLGSIVLWRSDKVVIARRPYEPANVGRAFPKAGVFEQLARAPSGVYETSSATDGVHRLVAYRQVPDTSLVVVASLAYDEFLAAWWKDILLDLGLAPFLIVVLLWFGMLIGRETRERERAESEARDKSALLELTLENMDQGLLMIDDECITQVCNRRAIELLDLPPALMGSRPHFSEVARHQAQTGEFTGLPDGFRQWVEAGGFEREHHVYERERPTGRVLEIRTVPFGRNAAVRTYTDVTSRKEAERRIAHMARHDALTGLPNRTLFHERLEEALAGCGGAGDNVALLCLDLDHFKTVNDTLGHPTGDALLKAVAERLRAELRQEHTVARLGGDEFAILLRGGTQPGDATGLAQRLIAALNEPFLLGEDQVAAGVSIGIAIGPTDGVDADQLFKHADLALYRAKSDGRAVFRFFEPEMDAQVQERRSLELDLREALNEGQFHLQYQPLYDAQRNDLVGFEALLRWDHPVRGSVPPSQFIPVAEDSRLIVPLGEWALREACREAASWPPGIRLAVNVSAAQFRTANLAETVVSALAASGFPPARLELEITESILMQSNDACLRMLHQLRGLGVGIAMDDFGTGYSSLSYLRSFPFDRIKIDRSFVREMTHNCECAAIVRTIVQLGATLGIATIAEGVETREQLEAVRAQGCNEVQGYLFGRPRPGTEIVDLFPKARIGAAA
jgi:diguanylate cyclase (GGDEF)-like protein